MVKMCPIPPLAVVRVVMGATAGNSAHVRMRRWSPTRWIAHHHPRPVMMVAKMRVAVAVKMMTHWIGAVIRGAVEGISS